MIDIPTLKKHVSYDPETGKFVRLSASQISLINKPAGWKYKGYVYLRVCQKAYKAHRLAFFYMTGTWPIHIDHINGSRDDNRWCNLRNIDAQENTKNQKIYKNNTSGVHGVKNRRGRWEVYIGNSPRIYLGASRDWFDAVCLRKSGELRHGYHENHGRIVN